jgi:hypothetical protein
MLVSPEGALRRFSGMNLGGEDASDERRGTHGGNWPDVFDKTLQTTNIWLDEIMEVVGPDRQVAWHTRGGPAVS